MADSDKTAQPDLTVELLRDVVRRLQSIERTVEEYGRRIDHGPQSHGWQLEKLTETAVNTTSAVKALEQKFEESIASTRALYREQMESHRVTMNELLEQHKKNLGEQRAQDRANGEASLAQHRLDIESAIKQHKTEIEHKFSSVTTKLADHDKRIGEFEMDKKATTISTTQVPYSVMKWAAGILAAAALVAVATWAVTKLMNPEPPRVIYRDSPVARDAGP